MKNVGLEISSLLCVKAKTLSVSAEIDPFARAPRVDTDNSPGGCSDCLAMTELTRLGELGG